MAVTDLPVGGGVDVIVLAQSPISRVYYATGEPPATCWAESGARPEQYAPTIDGEVPTQPQAARCIDCTKSVRGSGARTDAACKFHQRLAVVLHDDVNTVYRLQLGSGSIFGKGENGDMPWKAYTRYLGDRGTSFDMVVTHVQPDPRSGNPKFSFRPVSHLPEETLKCIKEQTKDYISDALKFTVPAKALNPFGETEGFSFGDSE
jgi:hypothetical protein